MLDKISLKLIGLRVRAAREAKGWTQDQLAECLGLNDRQSVSDIENGKRALRAEEMLALTDLLDRDFEFFIDPFAVAGEAQFNWRADPGVSEDSLDGFELKAGQWIGLLRWLREQSGSRAGALKRALRLSTRASCEDAQERAESLAAELDLGVIPAETLIDKVERELDIPVLFVDCGRQVDLRRDLPSGGDERHPHQPQRKRGSALLRPRPRTLPRSDAGCDQARAPGVELFRGAQQGQARRAAG